MPDDPSSPPPSVLRAHGGVLAAVWRGDPAGTMPWAGRRWFWLWVFVVNAVVGALAWTTVLLAVSRTASMVGRAALGLNSSVARPHVSGGQLVQVAAAGLVVTFVVQVLRVGAVRLTFALREAPARLAHATLPVATGGAVITVVYLYAFVVCLVPATSPWFGAVAAVVAAVPVLTAEILVFLVAERVVPLTRSLLVPHVALTVAWAVAAGMVTALAVHLSPI